MLDQHHFRRRCSFAVLSVAGLALSMSCRAGGPSYVIEQTVTKPATLELPPGAHPEANDTIVNARFQGVRFRMWKGVALDLEQLSGRMLSRRDDGVVSLDDKTSFVLAIDTATVGLPLGDLARLMNTYVFAYKGAPLRDLSFEVDGQHLVQQGILHKGVDIPFEMTGEVSVTPEGEIRIHPVAMKICSINGQGLMKALGLTLAKLIDVSGAKGGGVRVVENDLYLNPIKMLPPPAISGRLVRVALEPGRLVQYFGAPAGRTTSLRLSPDSAATNFIQFRGGTMQFGRMFMVHADMEVVDLNPTDRFDFDIDRYREQLVAGYHRTLPDDGLLVFMPDIDKINVVAARDR
jgi:hypothetical protein